MPHDFRSDTVTLPTPAMMAAIAAAPLGDSARGDDPTVNALEARAAALLGKDAALFLPSGGMANLVSLIAHGARGAEVIVEADSHIFNSEGGGIASVAGAIPRPVRGDDGVMHPAAIEAAIRDPGDVALAQTRLICIENTHNAAGGTVQPMAVLAETGALARRHGLALHMDGARLLNAAAFLGVAPAAIARHVDSVWFSCCKGLGGPVGALLAGDAAFMRAARRAARMLGGGMRQAGLIAAPALLALEDWAASHRRDHALARRLAEGLAAIEPSLVRLRTVQTNIVNCHVADAGAVNAAFRAAGILANAKRGRIRFVTHAEVNDASVDAALAAARAILPRKAA